MVDGCRNGIGAVPSTRVMSTTRTAAIRGMFEHLAPLLRSRDYQAAERMILESGIRPETADEIRDGRSEEDVAQDDELFMPWLLSRWLTVMSRETASRREVTTTLADRFGTTFRADCYEDGDLYLPDFVAGIILLHLDSR